MVKGGIIRTKTFKDQLFVYKQQLVIVYIVDDNYHIFLQQKKKHRSQSSPASSKNQSQQVQFFSCFFFIQCHKSKQSFQNLKFSRGLPIFCGPVLFQNSCLFTQYQITFLMWHCLTIDQRTKWQCDRGRAST